MMSYVNRHNAPSGLPTDQRRYLNQQLSPPNRQMDLFPVNKETELNSLAGHWSCDSTVDLFSLTPADMDPAPFQFPDSLASTDTKDLFIDPFAASTAFSSFTVPAAEDAGSVSSDVDSDDRSWSTSLRQSFDMTIPTQPTSSNKSPKPNTRPPLSHSTTSSRWSSSPDIRPQELITQKLDNPSTSRPARKTRNLSQDSIHSSTSQDPQIRNAAKRAAHNIIEKRYRTNMNAKFLTLEKAISAASGEERSWPASAGSLKKSEILTNALAYIESVRQENEALREELARANQRLVPDSVWRQSRQRRG